MLSLLSTLDPLKHFHSLFIVNNKQHKNRVRQQKKFTCLFLAVEWWCTERDAIKEGIYIVILSSFFSLFFFKNALKRNFQFNLIDEKFIEISFFWMKSKFSIFLFIEKSQFISQNVPNFNPPFYVIGGDRKFPISLKLTQNNWKWILMKPIA